MTRPVRILTTAILAPLAAAAIAAPGSIRLSAFPTLSVADGRSTVNLTAEVRDASGRLVPDGTQVLFSTTLGSFRESVVKTVGGVARAVLVAGGSPGVAKITVSSVGVGAPTLLDYEFVATRADLSSAKEYIEISAPGYMQYTVDTRIVAAAAPNRGVSLRYRDVAINADDLQLFVNEYRVKARRARLKIGRFVREFDELSFVLNRRSGVGTTTYAIQMGEAPALGPGRTIRLVSRDERGQWGPPPARERFGPVDVDRSGVRPLAEALPSDTFQFAELVASPSSISARRATILPQRGVQFEKASIYVANTRVVKLPLFEVNFLEVTSPLVTESLLSVNDNQIALNYPQYLSLRPGFSSLLRFRTGQRYGRSYGPSRGAFLDYEMNWNRGDELDGNLTVSGLARNDWGVSARQTMRLGDQGWANFQLDAPAHKSLIGSASVSRPFGGFQASLSANASTTLRGLRSTTQDASLVLEKDPTKVGKLPVRLYYGLTATSLRSSFTVPWADGTDSVQSFAQSGVGLRFRAQSDAMRLDRKSTVTAGASLVQLFNRGVQNRGLAINGQLGISRQLSAGSYLVLTYDYTRDGFSERYLGSHRLSLQAYLNRGRTDLRLFGMRSLDASRLSLYGDMSYRLSNQWRLYYTHTLDQFLTSRYLDARLTLGFRLGWREVGLTWSTRTKRLGVQLLGASF